MKKLTKSKGIVLFLLAMLVCTVSIAEDVAENPEQKEVLTSLELRLQKRISVDFRDTPIDDVIRIMAEQVDVDVIKSPNVTGTVTAKLTNVPLEEALDNILAAHSYGYVVTENMIRVAPFDEIAQRAEKLVNKIYRVTYADVREVEDALKKFISSRGSISSNPSTSNIIVTDAESKIQAIDTFIEEIDRRTPQILVEARIYDITSKDRFDLGVEWQAGRNTIYPTDVTSAGGGPLPSGDITHATTVAGIVSQHAMNPLVRTDPFMTGGFDGATGKTESTNGMIRFGWLNDSLDIDVLIQAQQENLNATLLANPRILVLDNETAMIKIIEELAFQELTQTTAGGNIGTTEFREVGVALSVTPHVTRDNIIRLRLRPEFSIDTGEVQLGVGALSGFSQPVIDRREADTTLLIKSGQTVVLGGLRKKDISQQKNKVPFFGDIPLIGELFKFEGEEVVNSELVVFVTPMIMDDPVLTAPEREALKVTEFDGPKPAVTGITEDGQIKKLTKEK